LQASSYTDEEKHVMIQSLKKSILSPAVIFNEDLLKHLNSFEIQDIQRSYNKARKGFVIIDEVFHDDHLRYCLEGMIQDIHRRCNSPFGNLRRNVERFIKAKQPECRNNVCTEYKRAIQLLHYIGTDIGIYIETARYRTREVNESEKASFLFMERERLDCIERELNRYTIDEDSADENGLNGLFPED
jgi:hypothetical protein